MRPEDIEEGKYYTDGKGNVRKVREIHMPTRNELVFTFEKGFRESYPYGEIRTIKAFARWAKEEWMPF